MATQSVGRGEEAKRPLSLVLIYSWDMLRVVFALIGAYTAFAGGVEAGGGRIISLPLWVQIVEAVAAAGYAASLILVAVVLGRRQRWVRQAQMLALQLAIGLIVISFGADCIQLGHFDIDGFWGNALFALIDLTALYAMTSAGVRSWYSEDPERRISRPVLYALYFWVATSVVTSMVLTVALR